MKASELTSEENKPEKVKNQNAEILFFAAECMEFIDHGELRENLSLPEAVKAYQRICRKGTMRGPGIGFVLRDPEIPTYSDIHWPLYQGGKIATDEIQLILVYREHPLVKEAMCEMEQLLPNLAVTQKQKRKRDMAEMGER